MNKTVMLVAICIMTTAGALYSDDAMIVRKGTVKALEPCPGKPENVCVKTSNGVFTLCDWGSGGVGPDAFRTILDHLRLNVHEKVKLYIDNACIVGVKYGDVKYLTPDTDGRLAAPRRP